MAGLDPRPSYWFLDIYETSMYLFHYISFSLLGHIIPVIFIILLIINGLLIKRNVCIFLQKKSISLDTLS